MVTSLFPLIQDDLRVAASMRPSSSDAAIEAQEEALAAQKLATIAQESALAIQAAEAGVAPAKTDIERLRAAAAEVKATDSKLIEHATRSHD